MKFLIFASLLTVGAFASKCHPDYECCKSCNAKVEYTDNDGKWGVENNNWCIIDKDCDDKSIVIEGVEYSYCKKCELEYSDASGNWGYENNNWCFIKSSKCEKNGQTQQQQPQQQPQEVNNTGFPYCNHCNVYYSDGTGDWGIQNNDWCFIQKSKCGGGSTSQNYQGGTYTIRQKVIPVITLRSSSGTSDFATKPVEKHISQQSANNRNAPEPYYEECEITIENTNGSKVVDAVKGKVKVRGNWTSNYPKKGLRINFDKAQSILGLNDGQKFKNWVLLAEYKDGSMLRNKCAFDISRGILNPDGYYSSDGQLIELVINNEYFGVYLLAEHQQINEGRVNITKAQDNYTGVDIGYLLELDKGYSMYEDALQRFNVDFNDNAPLKPFDGNGGSGKTVTPNGGGFGDFGGMGGMTGFGGAGGNWNMGGAGGAGGAAGGNWNMGGAGGPGRNLRKRQNGQTWNMGGAGGAAGGNWNVGGQQPTNGQNWNMGQTNGQTWNNGQQTNGQTWNNGQQTNGQTWNNGQQTNGQTWNNGQQTNGQTWNNGQQTNGQTWNNGQQTNGQTWNNGQQQPQQPNNGQTWNNGQQQPQQPNNGQTWNTGNMGNMSNWGGFMMGGGDNMVIKSDVYSQQQHDFIASFVNNAYKIMYEAAYNRKSYQFTNNYSSIVESSISPKQAILNVVEADSLADLYIISEITCDADLYYSSFFLDVDFGPNGSRKLRFEAPWDFDSALGNKERCTDGKGFFAANIIIDNGGMGMSNVNPWLAVIMYEDWFQDLIRTKWNRAYNNGVFTKALNMLSTQTQTAAEAFDRNYSKWDNIRNNKDFANELSSGARQCKTQYQAASFLYSWLQARIQFINNYWGH